MKQYLMFVLATTVFANSMPASASCLTKYFQKNKKVEKIWSTTAHAGMIGSGIAAGTVAGVMATNATENEGTGILAFLGAGAVVSMATGYVIEYVFERAYDLEESISLLAAASRNDLHIRELTETHDVVNDLLVKDGKRKVTKVELVDYIRNLNEEELLCQSKAKNGKVVTELYDYPDLQDRIAYLIGLRQ